MGSLVRVPPLSTSVGTGEDGLLRLWPSPLRRSCVGFPQRQLMTVEAKGKRGGMAARQFQRPPPPPLPKIEDDGNPKFVIFIRTANLMEVQIVETNNKDVQTRKGKKRNSVMLECFIEATSTSKGVVIHLGSASVMVYLWYPLSLITGGTTAKIMVAAKDNFLGKYIYKDTIARNLAAVIYKDEKEIQKTAFKQYRVLRSAKEFRYGYKLVENSNIRSALSTFDVIELPRQEELKTVVDKVKDFIGDTTSGAKESFGKLTSLGSMTPKDPESTLKTKN